MAFMLSGFRLIIWWLVDRIHSPLLRETSIRVSFFEWFEHHRGVIYPNGHTSTSCYQERTQSPSGSGFSFPEGTQGDPDTQCLVTCQEMDNQLCCLDNQIKAYSIGAKNPGILCIIRILACNRIELTPGRRGIEYRRYVWNEGLFIARPART